MSDDANNSGSGGRALGGGNAEPLPASWANRGSGQPRIGRIGGPPSSGTGRSSGPGRMVTLGDLQSGGAPRGRQQRMPSDDEDDDDAEEGERWFAGGERSGLSIENPGRPPQAGGGLGTVRDILRKAAEGGPPPEPAASGSGAPTFWGSGNTLGSDELPSQHIPDPNAAPIEEEDELETAVREITFWRDGFSIQDGPLLRYDDPTNANILESINSGNAPPSTLNVQVGQPVELRVSRRLNEDYVPPPKKFTLFEGTGHRLGALLPGEVSTGAAAGPSSQPPGAFPTGTVANQASSAGTRESFSTKFEVDMTAPTTSIQIRLADGTRLVSRMNLTHTVGDIRSFINASRPGQSAVPYTIQTTFPNKVLDDNSQTIQAAGLANSVIVQRLA